MTLKEFYNSIGGNYQTMTSRFLDESRVKKYVLMFKSDRTYEELLDSIDAGDIDTAFRNVHTLKGLAANLGFDSLFKASSLLTEVFRNYRGDSFRDELSRVKYEYEKVMSNINKLD